MIARTAIIITVTDNSLLTTGLKIGFNKDITEKYYEESSNSSGVGFFVIGATASETRDNILSAFIRDYENDSLIYSIKESEVDGSVLITLDGDYGSSVQPYNEATDAINVEKSTRLMNFNIRIGDQPVNKIYIGNQEVKNVYVGDNPL